MIKKAFSMIEISLVLIIIGVVAAGLVKGSSLIKSAQLASARSLTIKSVVPNIDGLVVWYETSLQDSFISSESSSDGSSISKWYDISPSSILSQKNVIGKNVSNATYKTNGINGIPSLYFAGSINYKLSSFYQGYSTSATVFIVFQPQTTLSATLIDSISGATNRVSFTSTYITLNAGTSANTSTASNPASFVSNQNYILCAYFNGASSKAYSNNAAVAAGNGTIDAGSNSFRNLTIGSNADKSNSFKGLISEVIIFNRPLKEKERKDIFRYLSIKYKISVKGL
ncbi:MAG: prepilin-type N-terminal cleavage/methylation domain-containing protein [Proteobacteria bacterium]|nr:prepilin-type N-terminal cleavage/methylation domain-containing protein [Pseudomonadota bacterium]